jgi:hypothetical protein
VKAPRILLVAIVVGVLGIGMVAYLRLSGSESMCGSHVVRRIPSPDGHLEAVIFENDCGAMTDFGTGLSVVTAGGDVGTRGGNLLVADSDHGRAPLDSGFVIRLSVQWMGSDSLVVRYDRRARVFQQKGRAHGVSVRYVPVDERGA